MMSEQRRPDPGQFGEAGNGARGMLTERLLRVGHSDERRDAGAEQARREARRVLIGVEPDHEHAEDGCERSAGDRARRETQRSLSCVCTTVAKPAIAATSIMPSAPRLTMPERSFKSSPRLASATAVPASMLARHEQR